VNVDNETLRRLMTNDAVYKFKRYEASSLSYTGINKHEGEDIGRHVQDFGGVYLLHRTAVILLLNLLPQFLVLFLLIGEFLPRLGRVVKHSRPLAGCGR
jgi:hypothetical protein